MNLTEILQGFSHVAPKLAGMVSLIPGGQIPGALLGLLGSFFGGTDEDTVAKAIAADPEAAVKLRQIDSDERLGVIDRDLQARKMAYDALQQSRDWIKELKWFVAIYCGWSMALFTVAFLASIFTTVVISQEEQWLLAKLSIPVVGIMTLATRLIAVKWKSSDS